MQPCNIPLYPHVCAESKLLVSAPLSHIFYPFECIRAGVFLLRSINERGGAHATMSDAVSQFDHLPDDSIISDHVAAKILGVSIWTLRRASPVPRRQISDRRFGRRVGDIRAKVRGTFEPQPAA